MCGLKDARPFSLVWGVLVSTLLVGCTASVPEPSSSLPDNPLPACPASPNCERTTQAYDVPTDTLYTVAQRALEALGPVSVRRMAESGRVEAVYRVALVFKDDVAVAVEPHGDGSVLHVRSASRVGHSDLGVNARRVNALLEAVSDRL